MMSQPSPVNPYAPSEVDDPLAVAPLAQGRHLGTWIVLLSSFVGVLIAGGGFGAIIATLITLFGGAFQALLGLIPMGIVVGMFLAGAFFLPIATVAFLFSLLVVPFPQRWTTRQARRFAGVCGFLVGFFSVSITSGPSIALLFGLLPGAFGGTVATLVASWILRSYARRSTS